MEATMDRMKGNEDFSMKNINRHTASFVSMSRNNAARFINMSWNTERFNTKRNTASSSMGLITSRRAAARAEDETAVEKWRVDATRRRVAAWRSMLVSEERVNANRQRS